MSTPAEKQRMKKCRSAQRLLVKRLTATSKEWREINKEFRRQSISRERELRSPMAASQTQFFEVFSTRNKNLPVPVSGGLQLEPENDKHMYGYPIYARSTRNMVSVLSF